MNKHVEKLMKTCILIGGIYYAMDFAYDIVKGRMLGALIYYDVAPNDGLKILSIPDTTSSIRDRLKTIVLTSVASMTAKRGL